MAFGRRKRRRSSAVVLLNGVMTLLVLAIIAGGAVLAYGLHVFYEDGPKPDGAAFLLEKGSGLGTVSARLAEQGLVSNGPIDPLIFRAGTYLLGSRTATLIPGQYMIPAHASMAKIIETLTTTKPQEFFVNVIPGETSWQVAEVLNDSAQSLSGDKVTPPLEGTLLAVRHDFFPGDTRKSLVDTMQKSMTKAVADIWASHDPAIDDVIKSPAQLVTLASLVEKETGISTERADVASVFVNRLRKKMKLQTDPSVIYGLTLGRDKLDRGLTTSDLKSKTPYNTYLIDGLPPGPIANPGTDALTAVAHPSKTNYLYFVAKSADPQQGHRFASTYAEHRKNVALYRKDVALDEAERAKEALEEEQAKDSGDTTGDSTP